MFFRTKVILFLILVLAGVAAFYANRDIPVPQQKVEKSVSNEHFLK